MDSPMAERPCLPTAVRCTARHWTVDGRKLRGNEKQTVPGQEKRCRLRVSGFTDSSTQPDDASERTGGTMKWSRKGVEGVEGVDAVS